MRDHDFRQLEAAYERQQEQLNDLYQATEEMAENMYLVTYSLGEAVDRIKSLESEGEE